MKLPVMGLQLFFFSFTLMVSLQLSTSYNNEVSLKLNDDVLGLIVFKSDLHDPFSNLISWNEDDVNPCSWNYIKCDDQTSTKVIGVSLDNLGLSGKLNRGLEKLENLQSLSLAHNNFTGNLSPHFSHITTLQNLDLSNNKFSGRIPVEFNLSSFRFLDFSGNSLTGEIPDSLFQNCLSLSYISFSDNLLEGLVPYSLQKCVSLANLNFSNNHLSGNIDFANGIWTLRKLRILDLSNNGFSGFIPNGVYVLHILKEVHLQGNQFSGSLPGDFGLCPHLTHLDFSNNLFTGTVPTLLQRLKSVRFFSLSNNKLTGGFPKWISNMYSLQYLDFSSNAFSGNIPESLGDLQSLNYLSLSDNQLSGSIPKSLFELGLKEVYLSRNHLTGSIPPGSSRMLESVLALDLSQNKLTGVIPVEMGLSSHLQYLNISWNELHSTLHLEQGYFPELSMLDLRNNAIYGSIPEDLCESKDLAILQLDGNSMTGSIPEEIGNCSSLYLLSLSNNSLHGSIPKTLSKLKKLKVLNLELNELTGEIPQELGGLTNLVAVNVSYNRLTGRLPSGGIFTNLGRSSLQGNLGICSPLLKGPCKMNVSKPLVLDPDSYNNQMGGAGGVGNSRPGYSESVRSRQRKFFSVSAIIAISAALLIVLGVVVITLLNVSMRRRLAFVDTALESMCSSSQGSDITSAGKLVLFDSKSSEDWDHNAETLLNKASEIGRGVFGTVYKASIGGQGRSVAIKKLVTSNILQNPEDFDREVRILGKMKHPNLMTVKGYYWTPRLQLLIADYAPNGSLHSKLHERSPSSPCLSWSNRFKIALGTAKGLAHLHEAFHQPLIHYNVKPSNILLDENYNAKLSDFGLARLLTKLDKHVISSRFQSALGYVAPELACQSIRINEKSDIYGFGVLILELVTGRRPVEYGEDDVVVLGDHVRVLLEQGNMLDCVDPSMNEYPEEEVLPVLKLGLVCTSQIPSSRPSMSDVVQILQVIKTPIPQQMEAF
ncbi:hypothetical protein MKX01_028612 [Papaver californicum]|nr:hypothetical protein MKX01_028612 [Papaver californicum]